MLSLWFALKDFKARAFQVRMVMFVITFLTADFTFAFMFLNGKVSLPLFLPLFMLIVVALSVTLLHLAARLNYDVGVLKALGAGKSTVTATLFIELTLVGVVGVFIGIISGVGFTYGLLAITPILDSQFSLEAFGLLLVFCLLGVLVGAVVGAYSAWKESGKTVVETLTRTK